MMESVSEFFLVLEKCVVVYSNQRLMFDWLLPIEWKSCLKREEIRWGKWKGEGGFEQSSIILKGIQNILTFSYTDLNISSGGL